MESDTNFGHLPTMLVCAKMGCRRPACLTSCPLADATPRVQGGDLNHYFSPVEDALIRAHYPTGDLHWLQRVTGRSENGLGCRARRIGVVRADTPARRQAIGKRIQASHLRHGRAFNPGQAQFILQRHATGPWPLRGGNTHQASALQARYALQEEIVDEVARLGSPRTWRAIVQFVASHSPANQRPAQRERRNRLARERSRRQRVARRGGAA